MLKRLQTWAKTRRERRRVRRNAELQTALAAALGHPPGYVVRLPDGMRFILVSAPEKSVEAEPGDGQADQIGDDPDRLGFPEPA